MAAPFCNVYNYNCPDLAISEWLRIFYTIYDKHIPKISKRVKTTYKPSWFNNNIESAINKRDWLKRYGTSEDFCRQRNYVKLLVRRSKKEFFNKLLSGKPNSKSIWTAINQIIRKKRTCNTAGHCQISADDFNNHFISSVALNTDADYTISEELKNFCNSAHRGRTELIIPLLTVHEVYVSLRSLKPSSTTSFDDISNNVLKISAPIISEVLTYVYNLCIAKHYYPTHFKHAKVIPLHKKGNIQDANNYRPISILSSLSKPLEIHINKCISNYLEKLKLFHSNQSGFRKFHSCHTALIKMNENWLKNINKKPTLWHAVCRFQKSL